MLSYIVIGTIAITTSTTTTTTHGFSVGDGVSAKPRTTNTITTSQVYGWQGRFSTRLCDASSALYEVQEQMLVDRGKKEAELMKDNYTPLEANKPKGVGASGGFGGGGGGGGKSQNKGNKSKSAIKEEGKSHAKVLKAQGVVRIDNVLPGDLADRLREYVVELRATSTAEVASGQAKSIDRFADVLLKENRCDLKIPLGPPVVMEALENVFVRSAVGSSVDALLGRKASLYELACLISDPGSNRQVVHPDNPYLPGRDKPTLLTCFIALQDVTLEMGPTVWIPQTHTEAMHQRFGDTSTKDDLLSTQPAVLGLLTKGSCAIFDSRLLHCGSANSHPDQSRALFYVSMKNPDVGYPGNVGSIRQEIGSAGLTLEELTKELGGSSEKKKKKSGNTSSSSSMAKGGRLETIAATLK